jgi:hypothetical protein
MSRVFAPLSKGGKFSTISSSSNASRSGPPSSFGRPRLSPSFSSTARPIATFSETVKGFADFICVELAERYGVKIDDVCGKAVYAEQLHRFDAARAVNQDIIRRDNDRLKKAKRLAASGGALDAMQRNGGRDVHVHTAGHTPDDPD